MRQALKLLKLLGNSPRSSFTWILPLVFAFDNFCGVSRKDFLCWFYPVVSLFLEKSLPSKRTMVTRHGDSRSLILGGWHVWYKIWYLILIGLQWSLPYVGGGQCFETSSFVRANSRGLVTGGRRLPDEGGISLERDGLRTHQPNQSWQNWHWWACSHFFFLSCWQPLHFLSQNTPNGFLDLKYFFQLCWPLGRKVRCSFPP